MNSEKLVLIADDQVQVRSALNLLLAQQDGLQLAGEAADTTSLLLAVVSKKPDVILLDWELPGLPVVQLLRLLRYERPQMKIVAMSSRPEAEQQAREKGVHLFQSKNEPPDRLLCGIQKLLHESSVTTGHTRDVLL